MTTAADIIGRNPALQEHWLRRVIALVIDAIIVIVVFLVFNALFFVFAWPLLWWSLFVGLIALLYTVVFEAGWGATIGKRMLNLRVVGIDSPMDVEKAFIRNLSKLHPLLLFLDFVLGFFTTGDPRQRYLDRFARTTVTRVDPQAYLEEQFRAMQHQPPHPTPPPSGAWGQPAPPSGTPPASESPPTNAPAPAATGWPGQTGPDPGATWPKHEWDEQGQLKPQARFCSSCGGQLVPRGDGKLTCVRCGLVY